MKKYKLKPSVENSAESKLELIKLTSRIGNLAQHGGMIGCNPDEFPRASGTVNSDRASCPVTSASAVFRGRLEWIDVGGCPSQRPWVESSVGGEFKGQENGMHDDGGHLLFLR
jgi:hypothetical protein